MAEEKKKMRSRRRKKADRQPNDHYRTDPRVAECAISLLPKPEPGQYYRVLDIGSGTGVWGAAIRKLWPDVRIMLYGIDIGMRPSLGGYNFFWQADFLRWSKRSSLLLGSFDLVMGNLPFEIAEPCLWHAFPLMKPTGRMIELLPSEFRGAKGRGNGMFQIKPYKHEYQLITRLDFTGATDMRWHSLFYWDNTWSAVRDAYGRAVSTVSWVDWKTDLVQPELLAVS